MLQFIAISLFPEMFDAVSMYGVVGRAIKNNKVKLDCINPRDFTNDKHRTVDDRPYGGGPGMLMKVEPLKKAVQQAKVISSTKAKVIYLSPQGKKLDHKLIKELSEEQHLILLSGRYEGVDQRIIDQEVDIEVSIGDFVLSGGELAAMVLIDSITRLVPDVLGHKDSALEDSFEDGLLDHPHYTRPESYLDSGVPTILLGGDHKAIAQWRLKQRLGRTWLKRPDLLSNKKLSDNEQNLLSAFKNAYQAE
jgi:tRNA (guanine37-N1)-methyltransferase